jgi:hypothetical protein
MRPPSVATVRLVVFATVVLTALHFADNTVNIDTYPKAGWQPDWLWVLVGLSWPLFTAFGIAGYRLYRRGDHRRAHAFLIAYSYTGFVSLGHFLYGSPSDLTTRGFVSVLVDAAAGSMVLGVALWSIVARRRLSGSRTAAR